jgi:4-hydroxy-tetrahydrodipicolinate reductase
MNPHPQYDCAIEEQHHRHKADAPSGTALTLAQDILSILDRKTTIAGDSLHLRAPLPEELSVGFIRSGEIPGKHTIIYTSENDTLSLQHTAHNRNGFALGAVIAAEWIHGKKGFYHFSDIF